MSYVFDVGEVTVWSPALRVGDLYVRFVTQVGEVLRLPTGLSAMASDYYYIDPDVFEVLVKRIFTESFPVHHEIWSGMLQSVLGPSVRILDRIDRPLVAETVAGREFLEEARTLGMPTLD